MSERDNDPKRDRDNGNPNVVWNLTGDALRPSPAPYGFIGRNPLGRYAAPGTSIRIDLGVSANVPLLAFPVRRVSDYITVGGQTGCVVVQPGENVTVVVKNDGQAPLFIEDKESLVSLYPLVFSGTATVG
jgi:hypothetical protein